MKQNNTFKGTLEDLNPEEEPSSAEKNHASRSVIAQIMPIDILLLFYILAETGQERALIHALLPGYNDP